LTIWLTEHKILEMKPVFRKSMFNREPSINNQVYDDLADAWWDESSPLYVLNAMVNPWRMPYFEDILRDAFGEDLSAVSLLDVGSGGGYLAEAFARLGCRVSGIDLSERSARAANVHARSSGLEIGYQAGAGTALPFKDESFDVVACCDVLEHIPNWEQAIAEFARVLKPGGLFLFDTINRTLLSYIVIILGTQQFPLTRFLPPDTHIWRMFITPTDLTKALKANHLTLAGLTGSKLAGNPLKLLSALLKWKRGALSVQAFSRQAAFSRAKDTRVNYMGYAVK
jgi:2-polyprenyl-6-hydroxyphenyl methylase/3-demethylubiquinone-9 3-methyltransferase